MRWQMQISYVWQINLTSSGGWRLGHLIASYHFSLRIVCITRRRIWIYFYCYFWIIYLLLCSGIHKQWHVFVCMFNFTETYRLINNMKNTQPLSPHLTQLSHGRTCGWKIRHSKLSATWLLSHTYLLKRLSTMLDCSTYR